MNKWRLLLLSVLSLLQSASTESNFVDGRVQYRPSDTRLSNVEPYRIYKPLSELRHLKVRHDLQYPAHDAEFTMRSNGIRHIQYRQHHKQSPLSQDNKFVPTDHQRAFDTQKFRVYSRNDKYLFRGRTHEYSEALPIDIRKNRILTQNDHRHRHEYFETGTLFRITKNNAATKSRIYRAERMQHEDAINKSEPNFPDKRINTGKNYERTVHDRQADFSNHESANNFNKLGNRNNRQKLNKLLSRVSARNLIRSDVVESNDLMKDINRENIVRQKRSADTRLKSCVRSLYSEELIKNNHNTRTANNPQYRSGSLLVEGKCQTHNSRNNQERQALNIRRVIYLTQKRQQLGSKFRDIVSRKNTENIRQDRSRKLYTEKTLRNENTHKNKLQTLSGQRRLMPQTGHNKISRKNIQDNRQDILRRLTIGERPINNIRYIKNIGEKRLRDTRRVIPLNEVNQLFLPSLHLYTRSTENTVNIPHDRLRVLSTDKKVTNIVHQIEHMDARLRNMRRQTPVTGDRRRTTIIRSAEKRMQQDIAHRLSTEETISNEVQYIRNKRERKFENVQRVTLSAKERQQRDYKPAVTSNEIIENNHQDRSQRFSNGEKLINEIRNSRNIEDSLRNTRHLTSLVRNEQRSISEYRFIENTENIQQDRSRILTTGKIVTNEFYGKRIIQRRLLNTRRNITPLIREKSSFYILPETTENTKDIRRDTSRKSSSAEERDINVIRHSRNIRETRLLNTRPLVTQKQPIHSLSELRERYRKNTEYIRQDKFRGLSTGERVSNEIYNKRNIQKRLLNTRYTTIPLIRGKRSFTGILETYTENSKDIRQDISQEFSKEVRITNEIEHNWNIREVRSRSLSTGDKIKNEIQDKRSTQERHLNTRHMTAPRMYMWKDRSQRISTEERVTNKIQEKRNSRECLLNTRHIRPLVREKRYVVSKLSGRYSENTKEIRHHRSRISSLGERRNNKNRENLIIREKRAMNERCGTPKYSISELRERYIENTKNIPQDRSHSAITRTRTIDKLQDNGNIRQERLFNMRRASISVTEREHSISKLSVRFTENTKDISQSLAVQDRVINIIRNTRNAYDKKVYNTRRLSPLFGRRQYWIPKSPVFLRHTVNTESNRQHRSQTLFTDEKVTIKGTEMLLNMEHITPNKNRQHTITTSYSSSLKLNKKPIHNTHDIRTDKNPGLQSRTTHEFEVTRKDIREKVTNAHRRSPLSRERQYSILHLSGNPKSILNLKQEGAYLVTWQYLFYLLQAIYFCSLCLKMPKENRELTKKTRFADWFAGMDYLKID